jgi:hypothetical protein
MNIRISEVYKIAKNTFGNLEYALLFLLKSRTLCYRFMKYIAFQMGASSLNMIWDYIVFAVFILGCSVIAIYSKFAGPKERTKADYVFATGSVSMAAMMMSIARGTLGVRSFLGKSDVTSNLMLLLE